MFGVTPKKFVIVSALVAISAVSLCFTFGVPYGFIISEVLLAIDLVAGFYLTKRLILYKIESQRKKLEEQKLDQMLLDPKQKPDDVLEILIEKDSGYGMKDFLPRCIDRISEESLHKVPPYLLQYDPLFDLLFQNNRIQRLSNNQLYHLHYIARMRLSSNDPLYFMPTVELLIRKCPQDDLPIGLRVLTRQQQKERIVSEIKTTLKDRAWNRRRHAIAWRAQMDAENN
jgi:hypothetical protein